MTPLLITDIVVAPDPRQPYGPSDLLSVGVVVSGQGAADLAPGRQHGASENSPLAFWADLSPEAADMSDEPRRLVERIAPALVGQQPHSFRALGDRVRQAIGGRQPAGRAESTLVDPTSGADRAAQLAVVVALEEALLWATAHAQRTTPAALLAVEYGFASADRPASVPLLLEISDFDATAERIDQMLVLRPAGIGYRLTVGERIAEAIGENGEYLQRFVRELGQRADMAPSLPGRERETPLTIYLGLNGALGRLAVDPLRHIGKVLGHCVGLQTAAGVHQLILEEPFLLDDPVAQAANLHRLKDFLRRTPDSLKRALPTLLVARARPQLLPQGGESFQAELQMYADTGAVHALVFDPRAASMESVLVGIKRCRSAGIDSFLTLGASESPRWAATVIEMAWAAGVAGLLVVYDGCNDALLSFATRRLAELSVWPGRR